MDAVMKRKLVGNEMKRLEKHTGGDIFGVQRRAGQHNMGYEKIPGTWYMSIRNRKHAGRKKKNVQVLMARGLHFSPMLFHFRTKSCLGYNTKWF